MTELRLVPVVDFLTVDSAKAIAFSIGPGGEAIILAGGRHDAAIARRRQPTRPKFLYTQPERAYDATLLTFDGEDVHRRQLRAVTARFPVVQPLPYGEVLVVGRSALRGGNRNATVFDRDGSVAREFVLGDGIEDVQTTRDGAIWVSYCDEGIFKYGASGLARFDSYGSVEWEFEPPLGGEPIADCYALNVADDVAWAYYYVAFPLVRICGNNVEVLEDSGLGRACYRRRGQRRALRRRWPSRRARALRPVPS